ncbi:MAG: hypothetical protein H0U64_02300 [Gemmatimonadaceae bacterium]|nr:hypothetical protein [Gemmatimonadaceae bacterium]
MFTLLNALRQKTFPRFRRRDGCTEAGGGDEGIDLLITYEDYEPSAAEGAGKFSSGFRSRVRIGEVRRGLQEFR